MNGMKKLFAVLLALVLIGSAIPAIRAEGTDSASSEEAPGALVTTGMDVVDPSDHLTSLREAAAYGTETGETVRFAPGISLVTLEKQIKVSGALSIDGLTADGSGNKTYAALTGKEIEGLFLLGEGAELTIRHTRLTMTDSPEGCIIRSDHGTVIVSDSWFSCTGAVRSGGMLYADSGKVILKNCSFCLSDKVYFAVRLADASAEMLNCLFYGLDVDRDAVRNQNGRLNIISCMFVRIQSNNKSASVINAMGETHIINSVLLGNMVYHDVEGKAMLYATAYGFLTDSVYTDQFSAVYKIPDIFETDAETGSLLVNCKSDHRFAYPLLAGGAQNGCLVSVSDGAICLSKDGESVLPTPAVTSFTAEELGLDIAGRERRPILGPYCRLSGEVLLGDANRDDAVDIFDATAIQRYLAEIPEDDFLVDAADTDGDGTVSIFDATAIQRKLGGLPSGDRIGTLFLPEE